MPRFRLHTLIVAALAAVALPSGLLAQDLRGHGGPVRALAAQDGLVLSGALDTRVILWDSTDGRALRVLRPHTGNITAVAFLPDGGLASAGQEGQVTFWRADGVEPERVEQAHEGPVSVLALSPDGQHLASGGWDGVVRTVPLAGGPAETFEAHQGKVTGLTYLYDGRLASAGEDLRLRVWTGSELQAVQDLPAPPTGIAASGNSLLVIFADGAIRRISAGSGVVDEQFLAQRPLVSLAEDGDRIAVATIDGRVWLLDPETLAARHELEAGQGPIWALAFAADELFTGGGDGLIRRWDATTGVPLGSGRAEPVASHDDGSRGAQVWRACAVCHTLTPEDGNRAGPSLHGIFGRRIGTAEGYDYSDALRGMDIVWTPETVAALFEFGPEAYTPGSRMPEQRIPNAEDRAALVEFLERAAH